MAAAIYGMVDALLHGRLEERLTAWRNEGRSTRDIAAEVSDLLPDGIGVSHMTIQRWCDQKRIPKVKAS